MAVQKNAAAINQITAAMTNVPRAGYYLVLADFLVSAEAGFSVLDSCDFKPRLRFLSDFWGLRFIKLKPPDLSRIYRLMFQPALAVYARRSKKYNESFSP
jgi:hypothetical protein